MSSPDRGSLRELRAWWQALPPEWRHVLYHQGDGSYRFWGTGPWRTEVPSPDAERLRRLHASTKLLIRFYGDTTSWDEGLLDLAPVADLHHLQHLELHSVPLAAGLHSLHHRKSLQRLEIWNGLPAWLPPSALRRTWNRCATSSNCTPCTCMAGWDH